MYKDKRIQLPTQKCTKKRDLEIYYQKNQSKIIADKQYIFGQIPRSPDPSINQANQLKYAIDKTKNPYVSETKEAYNKYTFTPDCQTVLIELPEEVQRRYGHNEKNYIPLSTYQIDYNNNQNAYNKKPEQYYALQDYNDPNQNGNYKNYDNNFNDNYNNNHYNGVDNLNNQYNNQHNNKNKNQFNNQYNSNDDDRYDKYDNAYRNNSKSDSDRHQQYQYDSSQEKKNKQSKKKKKIQLDTRPPFLNYGNKNVTPVGGGVIYGNYMYSHNVNPHRFPNKPDYQESYEQAIKHGRKRGFKHRKEIAAKNFVTEQEESRLQESYSNQLKSGIRVRVKKSIDCIEDEPVEDSDEDSGYQQRKQYSKNSKNSAKKDKKSILKTQHLNQEVKEPSADCYYPTSYQSTNYPQQPNYQQTGKKGPKSRKKVVLPQELTATQKYKVKSVKSGKSGKSVKSSSPSQKPTLRNFQQKSNQPVIDPDQERFDKELQTKWDHRFLNEIKEKQNQNRRFTGKVTSIIPEPDHQLNQYSLMQGEINEQKNYDVSRYNEGYGQQKFGDFSQEELDPRNYKNQNVRTMDRIPCAGVRKYNEGIQFG